ncbi:ATP-binding cassette subfamily C protein/ATP-binding cassette subfamily C protein EexD [Breoghania corrubedonensis]|uniref:ATP-binding cassette subfamily C protein/ATP-binding cassette subfamily C protein EexD n=1 Tax=Breoghania corrubedonensis TaxID=665038 RepID=A0A2T5V6I5_9HYPH|nr:type I secretion system permease/ATPase [Breoghania corrubedonensis]PTW59363.1 ATP-binding cassette subfamily C protein/ATP-binding cassette subfamily C protein EexD [Breoghania corrubedonensis]
MNEHNNPLREAISALRGAFVSVGVFSLAINLLMLTGPLFMLQVYDRVLTSRSVPTLVALAGLVGGLFLFLGLFEAIRTRVLSRAGYWLDDRLGPLNFRTYVARGISGSGQGNTGPVGRPVQDMAVLRSFLGSPGLTGLFDLPWMPLYLAIVFLIHTYLGLLALAGALFVAALALATEFLTRKPLGQAMASELAEGRFADQSHRNAETIVPMGMLGHIAGQWQAIHAEGAQRAQTGGERAEVLSALSKSARLLLQSAILGLGAWLAIHQEITPGMIVATSIISGRALAPVDQVIGQWRSIVRARQSYRRLKGHLAGTGAGEAPLQLPQPEGHLQVRIATQFVPQTASASSVDEGGRRRAILSHVNFDLEPGDGLGVIGPSACGKSSLARLLVGAWKPDVGSVRLDGASLEHWEREALGRHIGYLPQTVELLPGSIRQNIARFDPQAEDGEIVRAAKIAGVHDMILRLPEGYATLVGERVGPLSGGQIQRIGLARALYGGPRLVVLDEPNSNLDADGDAALTAAIEAMRGAGSVVIVMAHRPSAIAAVNKVAMLAGGTMKEFGDKADVLRKVTRMAAG